VKHSGLFVTGTDTGVGKTVVASGLLRLLVRQGRSPVPFKPVETGCGRAPPADATRLLEASLRSDLTISDVCPITFPEPVAPAAAALTHRRPIRPAALVAAGRRLARQGAPLIVESAGGLLSPYGPRFTAADLAARIGLPLLLVARNALGTINHTALALAEIRRRRLPLAGYLLVTTAPGSGTARERNAELLTRLTGTPPLAVLPHLRQPTPDRVADQLARRLAVSLFA
jgi:dethiobiotin synthetase